MNQINETLKHIDAAWACVRENDSTIPSDLLDEFKQVLTKHFIRKESKGIGIVELCDKLGEDHIMIQPIRDSILKFRQAKHDCELTIATDKSHCPVPSFEHGHAQFNFKKQGLIVWIDSAKLDETMIALKKQKGISLGNT